MNEAIRSHIGGKKARESLAENDPDMPAGPGRTMPKEAIQFANQMGIDMTGIEVEAQDMWRKLTDMHEKNPLEYQNFIKQQMEEAKREKEEEKEMEEARARQKKAPGGASKSSGSNDKKKDDDKGRFFRPEAGFAFKVKTDGNDGVKIRVDGDAGRDLIINVCQHKAVQAAIDKQGREVLDDRATADGLQIPLIVGPVRECELIDKPLAVDVVIHPSVVHRCNNHKVFLSQMVDLALDWIKEETDLKIFRPKKGAYWKMCTNVYMGGRGEIGEIPVLFPLEYAMQQSKPKGERQVATTSTFNTETSCQPSTLSAPSTLLNIMREEDGRGHKDSGADVSISFSLNDDTSTEQKKKPLIQDLSEPAGPALPDSSNLAQTLPKESKPKSKPKKPSIKKGFLNKPAVAGVLYGEEGSAEGAGGAKGGTLERFMSRCQVVDTNTMGDEDKQKAMESYAKTGSISEKTQRAQKPVATKSVTSPRPKPSVPPNKERSTCATQTQAREKPPPSSQQVAAIEKLMKDVDDDWTSETSLKGSDEVSEDEWNTVFKSLQQTLGPSGAAVLPTQPQVRPREDSKAPVPPAATAQTTDTSNESIKFGPTLSTQTAPVATQKAFKLSHTMPPEVSVVMEESAVNGRHHVSLKFSHITPELMAKADVQSAKGSLVITFGPSTRATVSCKHVIEQESIVAKTSKKKQTLDVSAFMLKI